MAISTSKGAKPTRRGAAASGRSRKSNASGSRNPGSDTTLLVNLPDGTWVCSDDVLGRDPVIELGNPQSGNYNIWVGTYAAGSTQNATILISERDPR